ncbi:hypothetical protein BX070DRAFT_235814 [Coemansia spiralis]|nr:hypothetical protein BX070DRAFT_235814 [Coemansia spiralis]
MSKDNSDIEYIRGLDNVSRALEPTLRYTIAATAMASANKPHLIVHLVSYCKEVLSEHQMVSFVAKARESLLKMISTIGAPRVINGTAALMDAIDDRIKEQLPKQVQRSRDEYNYDDIHKRGLSLWNIVYSKQAEKLESKIGGWYPDLIEIIQTDLYGRLLSDCRILDAKSTELCTIGALVPIDVPFQLKSHVLGAGRLGASPEDIGSARVLAQVIADH